DIIYFSQRFVDELNEQEGAQKKLGSGAAKALESHNWPGNIRELKNVITRAHILADDVLDISPPAAAPRESMPESQQGMLKIPIGTSLSGAQRAIIMATLDHYHGDKRRTADALGISPKTLYNRLTQLRKGESGHPAD